VAMPELIGQLLRAHLTRADGQEDLCFAVWKPSRGHERQTALIVDVVLPEKGDREVHGNASFRPQYVERAISAALAAEGGIAFLHSHPAGGWQDMSGDDVRAETLLAPTALGATGLPLTGLTLGAFDGTWSARVWEKVGPKKYQRRWAESVREVGERLVVHFADKLVPPPVHRKTQVRTVASWGPDIQARIARLKVGVVGLGSVGSIVAEALARTGIQSVALVDYQPLEEVNLDRTLNASPKDVGRAKVAVAADALRINATAGSFGVDPHIGSVCEEAGYRKALDCDVLFSCVDRPWGRSVLNYVAYAHLIPVIDGGLLVSRTKKGRLRSADWKAHVAGPSHRCLLCLEQYDPALVEADRRGDLEDPKYLESLPTDHPARANENVFGFSLAVASLEVLQFLMLVVGPSGVGSPGPQNYHMLTGMMDMGPTTCDQDCIFPDLVAQGESEPSGTGVHIAAEAARRALPPENSAQSRLRGWGRRFKAALRLTPNRR
jgi:ThiF family protein